MRRLRSLIVFACSVAVGGVFITAGALKGLDVEGFARDIELHRMVGPSVSAILARVLVPLEIVAGAAAIIGYRRRGALAALLALTVVFIGATGWAWYHGNTEGCGCFGRYAARTPLQVIVEDLLLAGAAMLGLALSSRSRWPDERERGGFRRRTGRVSLRAGVIGILAITTTVFALASPWLPIDSLATALRAGTTIQDLGLDRVAGNLGEGDRLLVVMVLEDEASRAAVEPINALARTPGVPAISALTAATDQTRAEFFWNYAPSFEFLEVPAADLRRLYRRAPRTFRVHNGKVLQVWNGVPPAEEWSR